MNILSNLLEIIYVSIISMTNRCFSSWKWFTININQKCCIIATLNLLDWRKGSGHIMIMQILSCNHLRCPWSFVMTKPELSIIIKTPSKHSTLVIQCCRVAITSWALYEISPLFMIKIDLCWKSNFSLFTLT